MIWYVLAPVFLIIGAIAFMLFSDYDGKEED